MKKINKLLVICLVFVLVGCSSNANSANMPNPNNKYDLLQDVNSKVGGNLTKPNIDAIEDDGYTVISGDYEVGEYKFHTDDIKYTYRFSKAPSSVDISGYYLSGEPIFSEKDYGMCFVRPNDNTIVARWLAEDGQYVLSAEGKIDLENFYAVAYGLSDVTGMAEVDFDNSTTTNYYSTTVEEDGDNIIYTTYPTEKAEEKTIQKVIYICEGEKIVSIKGENIYESNEAAQKFYDEYSVSFPSYKLEINENVVKMVLSENAEGLEDLDRSTLLQQLKDSAEYSNNRNE